MGDPFVFLYPLNYIPSPWFPEKAPGNSSWSGRARREDHLTKTVIVKTSYLDSVGQRICSHDVELAEPQDTGKTLGK